MTLSSDLHDIFVKRGYKWNIGGHLLTPTSADILETLKKIRERLDNEPVGTSIDVGRLKVQKTDEGLETYIYIGDLP